MSTQRSLETTNGLPIGGLKRLLDKTRAPKPSPGERCEMCGEPISPEHSHVVNTQTRALMCTCRGCYLLFTHTGAAQGKYRAVPDRHLYDPAFALSDLQWDDLQIPVKMAFFFRNSALDRFVAFYPSPAGATESLLPLDTWDEVIAANPRFAELDPDVEALLLLRIGGIGGGSPHPRPPLPPEGEGNATAGVLPSPFRGKRAEDEGGLSSNPSAIRTECYLAPISSCYELVGTVRLHWRGFSGGEEAWREIDGFFADLRAKSRVVSASG